VYLLFFDKIFLKFQKSKLLKYYFFYLQLYKQSHEVHKMILSFLMIFTHPKKGS